MTSVKLRSILDKFCTKNEIEDACKDFLIQHALFEKIDDEWYMNCTIFYRTKDEGLYEIDVEEHDTMNVTFESWKGNYKTFDFCDTFDPENLSDEEVSICAHELYDDFKSKNFRGHVWTRSGYTSWNYFSDN